MELIFFMKKLYGVSLGVLGFLGMFLIPILSIYGGVWLYEHFYSVIQSIELSLVGFVVLLSIFSLIPNLRLVTGMCIYITSSIFGIILFLTWLYVAYSFSGIIGILFPPLPLLVLLFHGEFLIIGELVLEFILVYGSGLLGAWILTKYHPSKWLMKKIPSLLRYVIAIIVGVLGGQFLTMPIINALGSILGQDVINSTTSLSFVNLSYMLLNGFVTGLFAGLIAGKRGKLVAGIAQFLLLILLIVFELVINRDLSSNFGQYGPSFWAWVGLVPALIGGHYGVKIINEETNSDDDDFIEQIYA